MPDPLNSSFRVPEDPVQALIAITALGFYSRIGYRRGTTDEIVFRIIEPRQLIEGAFGLRIRGIQIEPDPGARTFSVDKIVSVQPDSRGLPDESRRTNTFGRGGFPSLGSKSLPPPPVESRDVLPPPEPTTEPKPEPAPIGPAWSQPWFAEYVGVLRECLMDLRVEPDEAAAVEAARQSLGLSHAQVRAAHCYMLGEELLGLAADGDLSDAEEDYLTHFSICMGRLGWAPH